MSSKQMVVQDVQALLELLGGKFMRFYAEGIWTSSGYVDWYNHVEGIFKNVERLWQRRNQTMEA